MKPAPSRVLVVANETATGIVLCDAIESVAAATETQVLVVAPALNSRLAHWTSSDDRARREAELRLARCVANLAAAGVEAEGVVGDADPLRAVEDTLSVFAADVIVVATHPEGRSNWLARDIVERIRRRHTPPVVHVVVDLERELEYLRAA